jgi:replication factor C subunit 3/5
VGAQLKIDQRVFLSPSKRKLEVNIVQSNFHIEITPRCVVSLLRLPRTFSADICYWDSEAGNFDRVVIQELLKEIAQTQQVDLNAKQRFKGAFIPAVTSFLRWLLLLFNLLAYRTLLYWPHDETVVIINEADSLSRDAQAALRRTMEKYMSNMRIILCANSTSRLIAPIKSRCLLMRVAAPTSDEVCIALLNTAILFEC